MLNYLVMRDGLWWKDEIECNQRSSSYRDGHMWQFAQAHRLAFWVTLTHMYLQLLCILSSFSCSVLRRLTLAEQSSLQGSVVGFGQWYPLMVLALSPVRGGTPVWYFRDITYHRYMQEINLWKDIWALLIFGRVGTMAGVWEDFTVEPLDKRHIL
jgi:hypothetical protein